VGDLDDDPLVKYSPPGLNKGERGFVEALRSYVTAQEGQDLLADRDLELFLLRNQSRGRGVDFLVDEDRVFPDFILWLKGTDGQDIVFIDPHGMIYAKKLDLDPKVQFHKDIKGYEQELNAGAGRDDISLHSYIVVSQTTFAELSGRVGVATEAKFNEDYHIYFPEQDDYVALLLKDVLEGAS
jgi:hypothetical protein